MNAKHHEKIGQAQLENGALGYISEFIYPHQHPRCARIEMPASAPRKSLAVRVALVAEAFISAVANGPGPISPELLRETHEWSSAHFRALYLQSPDVMVRLTMALRDKAIESEVQKPIRPQPVTPQNPMVGGTLWRRREAHADARAAAREPPYRGVVQAAILPPVEISRQQAIALYEARR